MDLATSRRIGGLPRERDRNHVHHNPGRLCAGLVRQPRCLPDVERTIAEFAQLARQRTVCRGFDSEPQPSLGGDTTQPPFFVTKVLIASHSLSLCLLARLLSVRLCLAVLSAINRSVSRPRGRNYWLKLHPDASRRGSESLGKALDHLEIVLRIGPAREPLHELPPQGWIVPSILISFWRSRRRSAVIRHGPFFIAGD